MYIWGLKLTPLLTFLWRVNLGLKPIRHMYIWGLKLTPLLTLLWGGQFDPPPPKIEREGLTLLWAVWGQILIRQTELQPSPTQKIAVNGESFLYWKTASKFKQRGSKPYYICTFMAFGLN